MRHCANVHKEALLESEIRMPTSTVESLIQQNKNLSRELNSLAIRLNETEALAERLKNENTGFACVDREREVENQLLKEKLKKAELALESAVISRSDAEKQFAEVYSRLEERESFWGEKTKYYAGILKRYSRFKKTYENRLIPLLKKFKSDAHQIRIQSERLQEMNDQFKSQLHEAYQHIQTQNSEHQSVINQMDIDNQCQLNELQAIITRLSGENSILRADLESAQRKLERMQNSETSNENRLVSAERRRDDLEKKYFEILNRSQEKLLAERTKREEVDLENSKLKFKLTETQEKLTITAKAHCEAIQNLKSKEMEWATAERAMREALSNQEPDSGQLQTRLEKALAELQIENKALREKIAALRELPKPEQVESQSINRQRSKDEMIREGIVRLSDRANKIIIY